MRAPVSRWFDGPPLALPAAADHLAERWAAAGPRARSALVTGGVVVLLALAGFGSSRTPWGPPVAVLVASTDLPAGHVLRSGDLRAERWPSATVPPGAPDDADAVTGRRLAVGLPGGTALTAGHLSTRSPSDGLPDGEVAVAVPVEVRLEAGQRVDLLGPGDGRGVRLATGARVLATEGELTWFAVAREEAAAVAAAAGYLSVALLPTPRGG